MRDMPKALWFLVIGMVINVTGASFLWPLNTIYVNSELDKSLTVAGLVIMLNQGASVIGNLVGGWLFDKIGGYRSVLYGIFIALIASTLLAWNHTWPTYVVLLTVIGFGAGLIFPSMYAMAGSVWKEGGRRAFTAMYVAANLGVAIGSALGGRLADISFNLIFIVNAAMYGAFFVFAFFFYRSLQGVGDATTSTRTSFEVKSKSRLTALGIVCFGYILCWIGYVQWQSTIAAYTQELNISLSDYSLLWTVNGALIVCFQPIVSQMVKRWFHSLKAQMIVGISVFIIAFIVASQVSAFTGFLTAMIIMTIGEMFVWPAVPTIANQLAPKGRAGFYQGVVNSTATGGRMLGPVIGGILADTYGMSVLFLALSLLFVISIVTTAFYDKKLSREDRADLMKASA